jgi:predicted phage terminase large subunit-like protein
MVFMPPRSGKSELVSRRLPAYIFGLKPDASVMATSYGADLASRMNRDVQRIIDSDSYREVFPNTTLWGKNIRTVSQGTYLRNSDLFEIVDHNGVYKCSGVGGGITGLGFQYGIIDDPIKDRKEAESKAFREALWDWYASTFYTRREKDARILITLTRWNEDDLAGRLLKLAQDDPKADQWEVISFPMIAEEPIPPDPRKTGDPLWPAKFSLQDLEAVKTVMGSYEWSALMQQRPTTPGGNIINRGWWKFYKQLPRLDTVIQSWDCTFKDSDGTDFVVGQVWGKDRADRYLLDQIRARLNFPATIQAIRTLSAKWPESIAKYIEDKANGSAVISTLQSEIPGLIPVNPKGGKVVRAQAVCPYIEAGNVYLPDPSIAPWIHDFIEECAAFPSAKHDDQVDSMTQALMTFGTMTEPSRWLPPETALAGAQGYQGIY